MNGEKNVIGEIADVRANGETSGRAGRHVSAWDMVQYGAIKGVLSGDRIVKVSNKL